VLDEVVRDSVQPKTSKYFIFCLNPSHTKPINKKIGQAVPCPPKRSRPGAQRDLKNLEHNKPSALPKSLLGTAINYTLFRWNKLTSYISEVEPVAYFTGVFRKLPDYPVNQVQNLLPFRWKNEKG